MSIYQKQMNKGKKRSDTPTPDYIIDFLSDLIKSKYKPHTILDPCAGDGRLTKHFDCNKINYEIKDNKDFLKEDKPIDCDMVIMNPPFNLNGVGRKLSVEVFLDKVLELCDKNVPIICITPMGLRLNQKKSSKRWRKMRDDYPPITSIISLPLDAFEDTLFHCEILCFNMDKLNPHYYLNL
jgi:hypothetical protein